MIHEVDETLRGMLRGGVLSGTDVDIAFDAPSRDWAARRNTPTIDAYLYDIREDTGRRHRGAVSVHNERGAVSKRRQPPRWFRLSYLVTAWTKRPEDEHRLLSAVLTTMLPRETLPPAELTGALAEMGLTVPVSIAVPPPESRSLADIWSALGGELKPSLDLVITAPFPAVPEYEAGPPALEGVVRVRDRHEAPRDGGERRHQPRHLRRLSPADAVPPDRGGSAPGGTADTGAPPSAEDTGTGGTDGADGAAPAAGTPAAEKPWPAGRARKRGHGGGRTR